ncbi:hypothetical protein [Microbulbifer sp. SAOS-129_SWC]|uniref:hypothetical protein n=1 Tax=Microbulbifer sp. SAOS-129_SWC TaxID=3145235 RepID=UPI00321728F8
MRYAISFTFLSGLLLGGAATYMVNLDIAEKREVAIYEGARRNVLVDFVRFYRTSAIKKHISEKEGLECFLVDLYSDISREVEENKVPLKSYIYKNESAYTNINKDLKEVATLIESKLESPCPLIQS